MEVIPTVALHADVGSSSKPEPRTRSEVGTFQDLVRAYTKKCACSKLQVRVCNFELWATFGSLHLDSHDLFLFLCEAQRPVATKASNFGWLVKFAQPFIEPVLLEPPQSSLRTLSCLPKKWWLALLPSLALFGGLHLDPDYAVPGAEKKG